MNEEYIKIEAVATLVNTSVQSINNWYRFAKQNPDNEYAKMLPEYVRAADCNVRLWKKEDIQKIIKFKSVIPKGRNGILGDITQASKRKKIESSDKYIFEIKNLLSINNVSLEKIDQIMSLLTN